VNHLGLILLTGLVGPGPATSARPSFVSSRIDDRVVKRFDFDERKLGNFERTPMNWRQIAGPGYPRFLEPRIDADIGHAAAPSMRLALQGGSLACRYLAKDIPVHPDSDYRVSVWVRTEHQVYSEASISACFLDHALQRIEESSVRCVALRGGVEESNWQKVEVILPCGFERARWIGISCHLEQPNDAIGQLRPLETQDPLATAWFDDIEVVRLPRVSLRMEAAGGVFASDEAVACQVRVADIDGRNLNAILELRDSGSQVFARQDIPIVDPQGDACVAGFGDLPPGSYALRLTISEQGDEIVAHERLFARLGPDWSDRSRRGGFGLILEPEAGIDHHLIERLVGLLAPDYVKVPLWRADMDDAAVVMADQGVDAFIRSLDRRTRIVGVIADPPASLAEKLGHRGMSVIDVLHGPAETWRPYLGLLFSRYGERVHAWQIGADDDALADDSQLVAGVLNKLRDDVRPLAGTLQLVVPVDAQYGSESSAADIESVHVPAHLSADHLPDQLAAPTQESPLQRWASLAPLDPAQYPLRAQEREYARRIVMSLQAGVEAVFVPQPWTVRRDGGEAVVSPTEEFTVFRTLRQTLGGLPPLGRVWLDRGVSAWLFGDEESDAGALVVWTDGDEPTLRTMVTDAAPAARVIEVGGRINEMATAAGGRSFELGTTPLILAPVSPGRVRTMASFAADPATIAPSVNAPPVTLTLRNHGRTRLVGRLRILPPASWQATPSFVSVDLAPGGEMATPVALRIPSNQAAGDYVLTGVFTGSGEGESAMTLRTPIAVGAAALDVNVMTRTEGRDLRIVQRVTNRGESALDLRGLVIAPNRPRQVSTIRHLPPGQSIVREYQLRDAASLADRWIRVSLEEVAGPLRHNDVIKIE
jgi:alpha-galactosidase-like protein